MNKAETNRFYIATFYKFTPLKNPEQTKLDLENKAHELSIKGLIIIGTEGFNSTCASASEQKLNKWKQFICDYFNSPELFFKESESNKPPFRRFKVKIRKEIVTTGIPEITPPPGNNHHLTPKEWNHVLQNEENYTLIDTRNWYEYKVGTFKGAINPNLEKFTEFPKYIEDNGIPKDKKILIFCTGGIRCEKGILELQRHGYDKVYQLEGGILNYIKEYPNDQFEGECFVFDHRVALDQNLQPTIQYGLCPHCGQPSEIKIKCSRCDSDQLICVECSNLPYKKETCSKNCAHHFQIHPHRKGLKQLVPFEIEKQNL